MEPDGLREFSDRYGLSKTARWELARLVESLVDHARSDTFVDDPGALGPRVDAPVVEAASPYRPVAFIGRGGMGEVVRVWERGLNRTLAMKTLRPDLVNNPQMVARFVEEAQITGQLQHPGIPPVHELGTLPDGRLYFTMKEVRGRTLSRVIAEVRATRTPAAGGDWTFRRLIEVFRKACEAVGYAHTTGIVHRDLKPDNVMVGEFGEVYVMDWGLARVMSAAGSAAASSLGAVAGTPAYMSPEQARGDVDAIDARSDVYALGAILYEILAGRPPYAGNSGREVLALVLAGPPAAEPEGPDELVAAWRRAMAREPTARFASANDLADAVEAWVSGARRREQALALVRAAEGLEPGAAAMKARAAVLAEAGDALLRGVRGWEPEERKHAGWELQDEAIALHQAADLQDLAIHQALQGALHVDAQLPEAHAALAERYLASHRAAEAARDTARAAQDEALLRAHVARLPRDHAVARAGEAWLKGEGTLSLTTEPDGVEVLLYRYAVRMRRLVPELVRSLGTAPIREARLPMGSYLCVLRAPGRPDLRYPVMIGRGEHWDGVPPGARHPQPIRLPTSEELGPDDIAVPAGWFTAGGDIQDANSLPRGRHWVDAFVMRRFPVTNREYLAFLNDLVADGREGDALKYAPRERAGTVGQAGALIYGRDAAGLFELRPDAEGDAWAPDWPVVMVDWYCAQAYARHVAERTGRAWRLPTELEWEKAARGVDGRSFPWGDFLDPSFCCMRDSHAGRALPASVGAFPVDESVYGVRGMGGNVQDWTDSLWSRDEDARVLRGGGWGYSPVGARAAYRGRYGPTARMNAIGIRLVR